MNGYTMTMKAGRVQSGENDFIWTPKVPDPAKLPVVLLHGSGTNNYNSFVRGTNYASSVIGPMAAIDGRTVVSGWFGNQSFANDTLMSRIETALTLIGATKAHFFGISMGGAGAIRYGSLNPSKTASIMAIIPLADIDAIYQANRLGLRADIGTAWGVTYPTALPASSNLAGVHGPAILANGTPLRILYSTADTSTLPAEVTALASSAGVTPEVVDAVSGHTEVPIYGSMNLDAAAPWKDYLDWISGFDA